MKTKDRLNRETKQTEQIKRTEVYVTYTVPGFTQDFNFTIPKPFPTLKTKLLLSDTRYFDRW